MIKNIFFVLIFGFFLLPLNCYSQMSELVINDKYTLIYHHDYYNYGNGSFWTGGHYTSDGAMIQTGTIATMNRHGKQTHIVGQCTSDGLIFISTFTGTHAIDFTITGYAHIIESPVPFNNLQDMPVCLFVPSDPCPAALAVLESSCQGVANVHTWDTELCEGSCFPCSTMFDNANANCFPTELKSFECSEYFTDERVTGLAMTTPTCRNGDCSTERTQCENDCGSTNVASFSCSDTGGSLTSNCSCEQTPTNLIGITPKNGETGLSDPATPPSLLTDDNSLQINIDKNLSEIGGNTYNTEKNTAGIADNTSATLSLLDVELNEANAHLRKIEENTKTIDGELPSSILTGFSASVNSSGDDTLATTTTGITNEIAGLITTNPMPTNTLQESFAVMLGYNPYQATCEPFDMLIPGLLGFPDRHFIVGCERSNDIKVILSAVLSFLTLMHVLSLILGSTVPVGKA